MQVMVLQSVPVLALFLQLSLAIFHVSRFAVSLLFLMILLLCIVYFAVIASLQSDGREKKRFPKTVTVEKFVSTVIAEWKAVFCLSNEKKIASSWNK